MKVLVSGFVKACDEHVLEREFSSLMLTIISWGKGLITVFSSKVFVLLALLWLFLGSALVLSKIRSELDSWNWSWFTSWSLRCSILIWPFSPSWKLKKKIGWYHKFPKLEAKFVLKCFVQLDQTKKNHNLLPMIVPNYR